MNLSLYTQNKTKFIKIGLKSIFFGVYKMKKIPYTQYDKRCAPKQRETTNKIAKQVGIPTT